VAAVTAGHSYRAIAKRFDLAPGTARRWYFEAVPEDPVTVAAALAFLAEGWSVREVADAAGVTAWTVRRWMRAASSG
jgi:transposase